MQDFPGDTVPGRLKLEENFRMIKPLYQELTYLTEKLWIHSFQCWEEDMDDL